MSYITRIGYKGIFKATLAVILLMAGCPNPPPPPTLQSLIVSGAASIKKQDTASFKALGGYSDGTQGDLTEQATWSSSDPSVATVSAGTVTGVAKGLATITATVQGRSSSAPLSVTENASMLLSIVVSPSGQTLAKGTMLQFSAKGIYDDGSTPDLTTKAAWSTSSPDQAVASTDKPGMIMAVSDKASDVTVTATLDGKSGSATLHVTQATIASISLGPDQTIAKKTRIRFHAMATLSDSTTQDLSDSVTWASSDQSVATIANAGALRGYAVALIPGKVTITAFLPNAGSSGSATLAVADVNLNSIKLGPDPASVPAGLTLQLSAMGLFSDDFQQDLSDQVRWSSDNETAATVSNDSASPGLVKASTQDTSANISATFDDGSDPAVKGQLVFSVSDALVTKIIVVPNAATIPLGLTQAFTATGQFTDGMSRPITDAVIWDASSPNTAIISNTDHSRGLATSVAEGTVTISASMKGLNGTPVSGSATLIVGPHVVASISVSPKDLDIAQGSTQHFQAMATYSDSLVSDISDRVQWGSSNVAVATISNDDRSRGLATAVGAGTEPTLITATTSEGKSASTHLSVHAP